MNIATISRLPAVGQNRILYSLLGVGLLLTGLLSGAAMNAKGWLPFGGDGNKVISVGDELLHHFRRRTDSADGFADFVGALRGVFQGHLHFDVRDIADLAHRGR